MVVISGDFTFRGGVGGGGVTPICNDLFFWQNDFILRGKGRRVGYPFIRKKKNLSSL